MFDKEIVTCSIIPDEFTDRVSEAFDYDFDGKSTFEIPNFTNIPDKDEFNIGLIVGNSGSGKSILLKKFGQEDSVKWDKDKAIISHFETPDEALEKLFAVGLSSVPTLCKPYHVLSMGEAFRANMARRLHNYSVVDEFTSVVNRETAYSVSVSIAKYIRKKDLRGIVFASCHFDIMEWLSPDWIFNTNAVKFDVNGNHITRFPKLGEYEL